MHPPEPDDTPKQPADPTPGSGDQAVGDTSSRSGTPGIVRLSDVQSQDASDAIAPSQDNQGVFRPPGILAGVGRMILETGPVSLPLRGLGKAFGALSHADYRYLWLGAMLSNMGSWVQTVAMQWLIKTHAPESTSALWLGRAAAFQQIPTVLLLPLGGVLADRIDRRWIIFAGNFCLALMAIALSQVEAQGYMHIWVLMGVAVILGVWQAMLVPANQSLLPTLVSRENLPNAVALNAMQFNLSRAIGPAVGGVALVSLGAAWSFGINAFSYAAILIAVFLINMPAGAPRKHEGVFRSMAGGALYLRSRKDLILLLVTIFFSGFCASPVMFMLPALVEEMFDNSAQQYSKLLSAFGIGAVMGAGFLAIRSRKKSTPWRGLITMGLFGLMEATISLRFPFYVTLGLIFFCGMSYIGSLNRFFAATIGSVPSHVRGRVSSFHVLAIMLGFPLGSMAAGYIASAYSLALVMRIYGLSLITIIMLAGLCIWMFELRFIDDSDEAREHA